MKSNKKNIKIILFIILGIIVITAGFFIIKNIVANKEKTPIKTEEQIKKDETKLNIKGEFELGTTKEDIISKTKAPKENTGKNYVIDPTYGKINDDEFLKTYLFKDDKLIAVVDEDILDGTQKNNIAVTFQNVTSTISSVYPLSKINQDWTAPKEKYDNKIWSKAILNNNLELYSEFLNKNEYIRIIASGINYFDFLSNKRKDVSLGNIVVIYTDSKYKENIDTLLSLVTGN